MSASVRTRLQRKLPRMASWWVISIVLSLLVLVLHPAQMGTSLYKLNLIALAAVAGYWIDRSIFSYARPNIEALRLLDAAPALAEESAAHSPPGDGTLLVGSPQYGELYYFAATQIRRALIVAATILAVSLGA